jgi:hypothetical protein
MQGEGPVVGAESLCGPGPSFDVRAKEILGLAGRRPLGLETLDGSHMTQRQRVRILIAACVQLTLRVEVALAV